jgi:AcrR family transcriptional regulator
LSTGARAGSRRRLQPAERRAIIIDAATRLFAAQGYRGTSIDQIAAASQVTPPVIYDHFDSKLTLYKELLAHHFAALRSGWTEGLAAGTTEAGFAAALEVWFAYIEAHPTASGLLFRIPSDDPDLAAAHAEVTTHSRAMLMPLLAAPVGDRAASDEHLDLLWEVLRGALQGLAIWWRQNPAVTREEIVTLAVSVLWPGVQRLREGTLWAPSVSGVD